MSAAADSGLDLGELRDSARAGEHVARQRGDSAEQLWQTLASLGWLGLGVSEECGGLGQPFAASAVLHEELGRAMAPHSFIGATACLQSLCGLAASGSPAAAVWDRALRGEAILADATGASPSIGMQAGRLHGVAANVPDVHRASHLLLRVDLGAATLLGISLPHPAVALVPRETWDETRRWFDVRLNGVPERDTVPFVRGTAAEKAAADLAAHVNLGLACDALGGADAVFAATLEYLQVRRQFNRPIASFQAIKHRCADLATSLAGVRALTGAAGRQFDRRDRGGEDGADWRTAAAACRLHAAAVYREISEEAVQLHGGMGFTWDHECHRHLKRARCSDVLGGSPQRRKDAIAAALFSSARRGAGATPRGG
jgi:alkylation response protein AidB-like acyl-CoA dehydrogenase